MSDTESVTSIELVDLTVDSETEIVDANYDSDDDSCGLDMDLFKRQKYLKAYVEGCPVAMARPRFVKKTGAAYIPRHQKKSVKAMKEMLAIGVEDRTRALFEKDQPVAMRLTFCLKRPLHHFRGGRRGAGRIKPDYIDLVAHHTRKDCDNLVKLVMDAGNGILYDDDKQVVQLTCGKMYDDAGSCMGMTVVEVDLFHKFTY